MAERGEIRNRERAKQLRDFTGLRWGKITPTDIDSFTEFDDKLYVWTEAKLRGVKMPYGQRLAFQRLCDAIAETGRIATYLVVEHDGAPGQDIDYAACPVTEFRFEGLWRPPDKLITCRAAIDALRNRAGIP